MLCNIRKYSYLIILILLYLISITNKSVAQRDTIRKKIIIRDTIRKTIVIRDTVKVIRISNDSLSIKVVVENNEDVSDTLPVYFQNKPDSTEININYVPKKIFEIYFSPVVDFSAKSLKNNIGYSSGLSFGYIFNNSFSLSSGISFTRYNSELSNKQNVHSEFYKYIGAFENIPTSEYYIRDIDGKILETRYKYEEIWNPKADSIILNDINTYNVVEIPITLSQTLYRKNQFRLRCKIGVNTIFVRNTSGIIKYSDGSIFDLENKHLKKILNSFMFGFSLNYSVTNGFCFFISSDFHYFAGEITNTSDFSPISFTPYYLRSGFQYYF